VFYWISRIYEHRKTGKHEDRKTGKHEDRKTRTQENTNTGKQIEWKWFLDQNNNINKITLNAEVIKCE